MPNKILIRTSSTEYDAFLQEGFYNGGIVDNIHNHSFTEIHVAKSGTMVYGIDGEKYTVNGETALAIPENEFHSCLYYTEGVKHTAFQISYSINKPTLFSLNDRLISDFFREIEQCALTESYDRVAAYISFICSEITDRDRVMLQRVRDYSFLIHEFISGNYNRDLHLSELAEYLHLSERQTERLVLEAKGKSFRHALSDMRISIAKMLMNSTDMSLSDIAVYVGYNSYSGFWKALRNSDDQQ